MRVFVYGTLTDPAQAASVLDEYAYGERAVLDGLHRVDGTYPTLAPGGTVAGRILRTDDVATLDRYEGVERGLYVRVSVTLADERRAGSDRSVAAEQVDVYVGDPDRLDAPAEWPGDGPFAECVRSYVDDADVVVQRTTDSSPSERRFGDP